MKEENIDDPMSMVKVKSSQMYFYKNTELFYKSPEGKYVLYKQAGCSLADMRIESGKLPKELYLKAGVRMSALVEVQKGFNKTLKAKIVSNDQAGIRSTLSELADETLSSPASKETLGGLAQSVDIIIGEYAHNQEVVSNLVKMAAKDYTTIHHSINVMALVLGFLLHYDYDDTISREIGMSALLHDIGKTRISDSILNATRKLNVVEFKEIQRHTTIGGDILQKCKFTREVVAVAINHHEKTDGSGYPHGINHIDFASKLVSLVDSYEALTCDERPYRRSATPFEALKIIKKEVKKSKYDRELFKKFVICLG